MLLGLDPSRLHGRSWTLNPLSLPLSHCERICLHLRKQRATDKLTSGIYAKTASRGIRKPRDCNTKGFVESLLGGSEVEWTEDRRPIRASRAWRQGQTPRWFLMLTDLELAQSASEHRRVYIPRRRLFMGQPTGMGILNLAICPLQHLNRNIEHYRMLRFLLPQSSPTCGTRHDL